MLWSRMKYVTHQQIFDPIKFVVTECIHCQRDLIVSIVRYPKTNCILFQFAYERYWNKCSTTNWPLYSLSLGTKCTESLTYFVAFRRAAGYSYWVGLFKSFQTVKRYITTLPWNGPKHSLSLRRRSFVTLKFVYTTITTALCNYVCWADCVSDYCIRTGRCSYLISAHENLLHFTMFSEDASRSCNCKQMVTSCL